MKYLKPLALVVTLGVMMVWWTSPASAQTSPGWVQGQVPTASQWNQAFGGKVDYNPAGCAVAAGCTGVNNLPAHTLPIGNGTSPVNNTGTGTAGNYLVSGGASADPSWVQLISGTPTIGDCTKFLTSTTIADSGGPCAGTGAPGGSTTQLQGNNAGSFGGTVGLTWNFGTNTLTLPDGSTWNSTQAVRAKTEQFSNTATSGTPALSMASASAGLFGCLYSSASNTFGVGTASTSTSNCLNPAFSWTNSALTLLLTTTLPDTGTLSSTVNNFTKAVSSANSATASFPAVTWASPSSGNYGCLYSISTSTFAIGQAGTPSGGCTAPEIEWTNVSGSLLFPVGFRSSSTNSYFYDSTNTVLVATISYAGAVPAISIPHGGAYEVGSTFLSEGGAGGTLDLGTAVGGTTGTLNLATLNAPTTINGPSNAGFQTDLWNSSTFRISQALTLAGGAIVGLSQANTVPNGNGIAGMDNTTPGYAWFVRSGGGSGGNGPLSIYSNYSTTYQLAWIHDATGLPLIGSEAGPNPAVEIGSWAEADNASEVISLVFGDHITPPNSIQHITVTTPGTLYTQATTTATLSGGGCTSYPSLLVTVNNTTGQVTAIGVAGGGYDFGCTSPPTVAINSSGSGTGAAATVTLVPGTTSNANIGPYIMMTGGSTSNGGSFTGIGMADIHSSDMRVASASNWSHAFTGSSGSIQPYFHFPGGITFDVGAGGVNNATFNIGSSLHDCNNQVGGSAGEICLTTTETGTTGGGLKLGYTDNIPYTVATLPSPTAGRRAYVSDSTVAMSGNAGAIVAGGGTNGVTVFADGTNWRIGG